MLRVQQKRIKIYISVSESGRNRPLGGDLMCKEAKKSKGAIRGWNIPNGSKIINHYLMTELTSVSYYYNLLVPFKFLFSVIIVRGCC